MNLGMKYGNEIKNQIESNIKNHNEKIDWQNFNWPPFINIVHYDTKYLKEEEKLVMKYLKISNFLILVYFLANFIDSIIQIVNGFSWTRVLSNIISFIIFFSLKLHLYYLIYLHILKKKILYKFFYYLEQVILNIFYLSFIVADYLCFNGFLRIKVFKSKNKSNLIVIIVVEVLILLSIIFFEVKAQINKFKLN